MSLGIAGAILFTVLLALLPCAAVVLGELGAQWWQDRKINDNRRNTECDD